MENKIGCPICLGPVEEKIDRTDPDYTIKRAICPRDGFIEPIQLSNCCGAPMQEANNQCLNCGADGKEESK